MLSKPFKNQSNFALVNIRTNLKVKIYGFACKIRSKLISSIR